MQDETAKSGQLPALYEEVLYWKLGENRRQFILINLIAIPVGLVMGAISFGLLASLRNSSSSAFVFSINLLWLVAAIVLTLLLHELIHGLAMKRYGASPRYGVKITLLALYATAPGYAFTRDQFVYVALAPLVIITLLTGTGIVLAGGTAVPFYLAICATLNAAGASGDLYMTYLVRRYPPHAYVIDEADGIRIFMPVSTR